MFDGGRAKRDRESCLEVTDEANWFWLFISVIIDSTADQYTRI